MAAGLGARDVAQVDACRRRRAPRPATRVALAGREARGGLPHLRQRHDRARRQLQPAAGREERRADARSGGPRERCHGSADVLVARCSSTSASSVQPQRRSSANGVQRAAHAAAQRTASPSALDVPRHSRHLAVERQRGAAVVARVVAAGEELLPAALVVLQEGVAVRSLARRAPGRLQAPRRLEQHVDAASRRCASA